MRNPGSINHHMSAKQLGVIKHALWMAGCATIALTAAPVLAQETEGSAPQASTDDSGNVIIVTARRREERLTDVPLSITAVSGEQLERSGKLEITEIAQEVPNLTLESPNLSVLELLIKRLERCEINSHMIMATTELRC